MSITIIYIADKVDMDMVDLVYMDMMDIVNMEMVDVVDNRHGGHGHDQLADLSSPFGLFEILENFKLRIFQILFRCASIS